MTHQRQQLARFGETWVSWYLRLAGYRVLERNLRTPVAEIDILARYRNDLVVCEVKTRRGKLEVPLHGRQQRRLARAAQWVWPRYGAGRCVVRIDLLVVRLPTSGIGLPRVEHVRAAFGEEVLSRGEFRSDRGG